MTRILIFLARTLREGWSDDEVYFFGLFYLAGLGWLVARWATNERAVELFFRGFPRPF